MLGHKERSESHSSTPRGSCPMISKVNRGSGSASKEETENKEIYTSCLLETHAALHDTFHSEHPEQWGAATVPRNLLKSGVGQCSFVLRPLLVDPKSSTSGEGVTRSKVASCFPLPSSQQTLTYFPGNLTLGGQGSFPGWTGLARPLLDDMRNSAGQGSAGQPASRAFRTLKAEVRW